MPSHLLSRLSSLPVVIILLTAAIPGIGRADGSDRVIFKNGQEMDGLIVKGGEDSITLRHAGKDEIVSRNLIRRIDDTSTTDAYFAASGQTLPPWNAIVNDLRANEEIHRLRLVSTGRETTGPFAGVPFIVFEMNDAIDVRVYGDPKDPAGLQLGLRAAKAGDQAERLRMRSFFAGFLTERNQIAALYSLKMDGGEKTAGDLHLSFGSQHRDSQQPQWWLAAWKPAALAGAHEATHAIKVEDIAGWENGFERDRDGNLRPLSTSPTVALGY